MSFKFDRMNPVDDQYFAALEAAYYAGVNQLAGTIYETISEADGSVSHIDSNGVVIKLSKGRRLLRRQESRANLRRHGIRTFSESS